MAVKHHAKLYSAHLISLHLVAGAGNRQWFTLSGRIRVILSFRFARITCHVFFKSACAGSAGEHLVEVRPGGLEAALVQLSAFAQGTDLAGSLMQVDADEVHR